MCSNDQHAVKEAVCSGSTCPVHLSDIILVLVKMYNTSRARTAGCWDSGKEVSAELKKESQLYYLPWLKGFVR